MELEKRPEEYAKPAFAPDAFIAQVQSRLSQAEEDGRGFYLVDFEADYYSNLSVEYQLDYVVEKIETALRRCCKNRNSYLRIGLAHYAVLHQADGVEEVIRRIRKCEAYLREELPDRRLQISYGVYEIRNRSMAVSRMMDCARLARRSIQPDYQTNICVYDETRFARRQEDEALCREMERALEKWEFIVQYQPQVALDTGAIVGAEALVRWERPDGRMIAPNRFVPVFERNGLIHKLDWYVLERTCELLQAQCRAAENAVPIAVNFSPAQQLDAALVERIERMAKGFGIPCALLEIEITETALVKHADVFRDFLEAVRDAGISISLDDFGTGVSSLGMIRDYRFDKLKLDRSFLQGDYDSERNRIIVEMSVRYAQETGLKVVGEGVEDEKQAQFLRERKCAVAQGFYFARPAGADQYRALLRGGMLPVGKAEIAGTGVDA